MICDLCLRSSATGRKLEVVVGQYIVDPRSEWSYEKYLQSFKNPSSVQDNRQVRCGPLDIWFCEKCLRADFARKKDPDRNALIEGVGLLALAAVSVGFEVIPDFGGDGYCGVFGLLSLVVGIFRLQEARQRHRNPERNFLKIVLDNEEFFKLYRDMLPRIVDAKGTWKSGSSAMFWERSTWEKMQTASSSSVYPGYKTKWCISNYDTEYAREDDPHNKELRARWESFQREFAARKPRGDHRNLYRKYLSEYKDENVDGFSDSFAWGYCFNAAVLEQCGNMDEAYLAYGYALWADPRIRVASPLIAPTFSQHPYPICNSCFRRLQTDDLTGTMVLGSSLPTLYNGVVCTKCGAVQCANCKKSPLDLPCKWCGGEVTPAFEKLFVRSGGDEV